VRQYPHISPYLSSTWLHAKEQALCCLREQRVWHIGNFLCQQNQENKEKSERDANWSDWQQTKDTAE
jgi:hypothetical protein